MEIIQKVFEEVQDTSVVSGKQALSLHEVMMQNHTLFFKGIKQCFLKIIKDLLKAPKTLIRKYEQLSETFYQTVIKHTQSEEDEASKKNSSSLIQTYAVFQEFMNFFNKGIQSSQQQIKLFCAKQLFYIVKAVNMEDLSNHLDLKVAKNTLHNVIGLLRDKKSVVKSVGIKLASSLQYFQIDDSEMPTSDQQAILDSIEILKYEMVKIICQEEQANLRKLAVTNLDLNEGTFHHLVKRIRDKDPEIRATVFRKLIKEQIILANLQLADIYKLIYDGLGSRDKKVRDSCILYLQENFKIFKDEEGKNDMEEEQESSQVMIRKKLKTPKKDDAYKEIKLAIINFMGTFEIERTMLYPHLYEIIEEMTKETIKTILAEDNEIFCLYLKELLQHQLTLKKKKKGAQNISVDYNEMFMLRVLCQMIQDPEERKDLNQDVIAAVEDNFPPGVEFAAVVKYFFKQEIKSDSDLMNLYQCILLSEFFINCDQMGRDELQSVLIDMCVQLQFYQNTMPDPENEIFNDVYFKQTQNDCYFTYFEQPHYEKPIIITSFDLLPFIVRIVAANLHERPSDFITKIIQIISEIKEPLMQQDDQPSLIQDYQQLEQGIQKKKTEIQKIDDEIAKIKHLKNKAQNAYKLEKQKDDLQNYLNSLQQEKKTKTEMVYKINLNSLTLTCALLQNSRIDESDNSTYPIVLQFIKEDVLSCLEFPDQLITALAVKALALFMMMTPKTAQEHCQSLVGYLTNYEKNQYILKMKDLVTLKSLTDIYILYTVKLQDFGEMLIRIAFKSEPRMKIAAVEALCRLLYNQKLTDTSYYLTVLLILWLDPVNSSQSARCTQILTAFLKKYSSMNVQNAHNYEKAIEIFLNLVFHLKNVQNNNMEFNDQYIKWAIEDQALVTKVMNSVIQNQMNIKQFQQLDHSKSTELDQIGPQERLYLFFLKKMSTSHESSEDFKQLFIKLIPAFDFIDYLTAPEIDFYHKQFVKYLDTIPTQNKDMESFSKDMQRMVERLQKNSDVDENSAQNYNNLLKTLDEGFRENTTTMTELLRNLSQSDLIIETSGRPVRGEMNEQKITEILEQYGIGLVSDSNNQDAPEDDKENTPAQKKDVKSKKKPNVTKKAPPPPPDSESEEEVKTTTVKGKKKQAASKKEEVKKGTKKIKKK